MKASKCSIIGCEFMQYLDRLLIIKNEETGEEESAILGLCKTHMNMELTNIHVAGTDVNNKTSI